MNNKFIKLSDEQVKDLWDALQRDIFIDSSDYTVVIGRYNYNFRKLALQLWDSYGMIEPNADENFVFKFNESSGVYTLELE